MTRPLAHGEGPRVPQGRPELGAEGEVTVGASIDALKRPGYWVFRRSPTQVFA